MSQTLDVSKLREAVSQGAVAVRTVRRLQPAGGPGDKVFPPTYGVEERSPHKYATEPRRIAGAEVQTVVLDSVQSQANRMEQALLEAWSRKKIAIPVVSVDFSGAKGLEDLGRVTSLDAPHRLADALLRDSTTPDGRPFRLSPEGQAFATARTTNATSIYRLCPTALVFGMWDSTGPLGGLGAKFQRALVSEIVGVGAALGKKTRSRIDPAEIRDMPIYEDAAGEWTAAEGEARVDDKGKRVLKGEDGDKGKGKPSGINHGNVTPSIDERAGGVTVDYALHTTVLSLVALRRLRFRQTTDGRTLDGERAERAEVAAQTALAALGLAAIVFGQDTGYDLRSRCLLVPEQVRALEIIGSDGGAPTSFALDAGGAIRLLSEASAAAAAEGMAWQGEAGEPILTLQPSPRLVDLILRSRALATSEPSGN